MSSPDDPSAQQPEQPATPPVVPPPGYYGQPAAPYYYGPPAPTPANRGVWFAIGAGSMFAVVFVGLFVLFLIPGFLFLGAPGFDEGYDESFDEGYAYYVDQSSVLRAVEGPCANMRSAASDIDMFSNPKDASAEFKAFTLAIKGVVEAIDAGDPNSDSRLWRDDWKVLSAALDTYADGLAAKGVSPKFRPLADDKQPLLDRMRFSSEADCEVPAVIEALDSKMTLDGDPIY